MKQILGPMLAAVLVGGVVGFAVIRIGNREPSREAPPLVISAPEPTATSMPRVQVELRPTSSEVHVAQGRYWLDYFGVGGIIASVSALFFIYRKIQQTSANARVEFLPYVRIDIGPDDKALDQSQFAPTTETPPNYVEDERKPYYEDEAQAIDLRDGSRDGDFVQFSAWFRNYQQHSLGQAYSLSAFFVIDTEGGPLGEQVAFADVDIAYLEHGKPVKVRLCTLPKGRPAVISLYELRYRDVQNHRYKHSWWDQSTTNAAHGRLTCAYDGSRSVSTPEAWSEPRTWFANVIGSIRQFWPA